METITFKVHPITPISPKIHACNHFYNIFYLFAFDFSLHIFLLNISCMCILEREKKYPMIFDIPNFAMPKHTNVIDTALLLCRSIHVSFYDWRATVVRWLLMPFSQDFLVFLVKKSDTSVKYKRQLNLTHHKQEPQNSFT